MKRLLFILLAALALTLAAFAAPLYDTYGVLDDDEWIKVHDALQAVADETGFTAAVITDGEEYVYGETAYEEAKELYESGGFGFLPDGALYYFNFEEGSYTLYAAGRAADFLDLAAFDELDERSAGAWETGDYAEAFLLFADFFREKISENGATRADGLVEITDTAPSAVQNWQYAFVDSADLLTDDEEADLASRINALREQYRFDIAVITANEYKLSSDPQDEADLLYEQLGYGFGKNRDGVVYYINMSNRKYAVSTMGAGLYVFDDYGLDRLDEEMLPLLGDNDFYGAFDAYVNVTEEMLVRAEKDWADEHPDDINADFHDFDYETYLAQHADDRSREEDGRSLLDKIIAVLGSIGASLGIGGVATKTKGRQMNTTGLVHGATDSVMKDSLNLSFSNDLFLYSNVTRTPIPRDDDRSSGGSHHSGGGFHSSSSGSSHGGRSGSF